MRKKIIGGYYPSKRAVNNLKSEAEMKRLDEVSARVDALYAHQSKKADKYSKPR